MKKKKHVLILENYWWCVDSLFKFSLLLKKKNIYIMQL